MFNSGANHKLYFVDLDLTPEGIEPSTNGLRISRDHVEIKESSELVACKQRSNGQEGAGIGGQSGGLIEHWEQELTRLLSERRQLEEDLYRIQTEKDGYQTIYCTGTKLKPVTYPHLDPTLCAERQFKVGDRVGHTTIPLVEGTVIEDIEEHDHYRVQWDGDYRGLCHLPGELALIDQNRTTQKIPLVPISPDEPKNNQGRATCFWCPGVKTKKVQGWNHDEYYDVCERCVR